MKKYIIIISSLLLLTIVLLVYSFIYNNKKVFLSDEYYNKSVILELNDDELNKIENNKKTFLILVYDPLCNTSSDFSNIINDFSIKYNIVFYKMLFSDIKNTSLSEKIKYCPSLVLYEKGKIKKYLDAGSNDDMSYYESVDGLKKWLEKYVYLTLKSN